MAQLAITRFEAGLALSSLWGCYALAQYPGGRLSDVLSRKTILVAGLGFLGLGFIRFYGTQSYHTLVGAAAIVGVGAGVYAAPSKALLSELYTSRRGFAFGIQTGTSDAGGAVAGTIAIAAIAASTWHAAFIPAIAIVALALVLLHNWSHEPYSLKPVSLDLQASGRRFAANSSFRNLTASYALFSFTWQGVTSFLPAYLQAGKHFSPEAASTAFSVLFLIGMAVKPIAGLVGDRTDHTTASIGSILLGITGLCGILALTGAIPIIIAVSIFGIGVMAYSPVMQATLMQSFPDKSMGGDIGAARTIYLGVGSLGPTYVGYVAGVANYETAFIGLATCLLASTGILLVEH